MNVGGIHSLSYQQVSARIPELRDSLSLTDQIANSGESTSIWCPITKAVAFLSFDACAVEGNLVAARVSLLAVPLLLAIVSRPKLQIWLRFRLASELFTGAAAASQSRSPAECHHLYPLPLCLDLNLIHALSPTQTLLPLITTKVNLKTHHQLIVAKCHR